MALCERLASGIAAVAVCVCGLLVLGPARAFSEGADEIAPGTRVRITAPQLGAEPVVGTLLGIGHESLSLEREGREDPEIIARSGVSRLEISRGMKSQAGRFALVGLGAGAAATVLLTFGDYPHSGDPLGDLNLLAIGVAVAAGGAAIGGVIGLMHETEQWEVATLPAVSVGIQAVRGHGVGVAVRLSWGGRLSSGR